MDDHRKHAYRFLLYWAMLDIRPVKWVPHRGQWLNPLFWWRHFHRVRALGELAEWLHNMAAFSTKDFAGFDEQRFWSEYEQLKARYPDFDYYRDLFESAIHYSKTGRWPNADGP